MTYYVKQYIRVKRLKFNRVSTEKIKIKIRLTKKYGSEGLVLTLNNVFYIANNSSNLVSLNSLSNVRIYHHNENQILYDQNT